MKRITTFLVLFLIVIFLIPDSCYAQKGSGSGRGGRKALSSSAKTTSIFAPEFNFSVNAGMQLGGGVDGTSNIPINLSAYYYVYKQIGVQAGASYANNAAEGSAYSNPGTKFTLGGRYRLKAKNSILTTFLLDYAYLSYEHNFPSTYKLESIDHAIIGGVSVHFFGNKKRHTKLLLTGSFPISSGDVYSWFQVPAYNNEALSSEYVKFDWQQQWFQFKLFGTKSIAISTEAGAMFDFKKFRPTDKGNAYYHVELSVGLLDSKYGEYGTVWAGISDEFDKGYQASYQFLLGMSFNLRPLIGEQIASGTKKTTNTKGRRRP